MGMSSNMFSFIQLLQKICYIMVCEIHHFMLTIFPCKKNIFKNVLIFYQGLRRDFLAFTYSPEEGSVEYNQVELSLNKSSLDRTWWDIPYFVISCLHCRCLKLILYSKAFGKGLLGIWGPVIQFLVLYEPRFCLGGRNSECF